MKRGAEFHTDPHRGRIDVFVARMLQPGVRLAERRITRLIREAGLDLPAITTTARVGYQHESFKMQKFTTAAHQVTDQLSHAQLKWTRWAKWLKKTGIDELAQINNIAAGEMLFFGWRPQDNDPDHPPRPITQELETHTYQDTVADLQAQGKIDLLRSYDEVMDLSKPGIFSSATLVEHVAVPGTPVSSVRRATRMAYDYEHASVGYYAEIGLRIASAMGRVAVRSALKR